MEGKMKTGSNPLQIPYSIYQVKDTGEAAGLAFAHYERAVKTGIAINTQNYDLVYSGVLNEPPLDIKVMLEIIFQKFNCSRPADFTGHSLSVSDVILIQHEGEEKAFYCDRIGFREISGFLDCESDETTSSEK